MNFDAQIKNYIKSISKELNCPIKVKKRYLNEVESNIYDYISEYPETTMADIMERWGTPSQIAESFIKENDYFSIKKKISIKKKVILIISAMCFFILILVGTFLINNYIIKEEYKRGSYVSIVDEKENVTLPQSAINELY